MCRVPVLILAWPLQASDSSEAEFVLKLCHGSVSEESRTQNTKGLRKTITILKGTKETQTK